MAVLRNKQQPTLHNEVEGGGGRSGVVGGRGIKGKLPTNIINKSKFPSGEKPTTENLVVAHDNRFQIEWIQITFGNENEIQRMNTSVYDGCVNIPS